MSNIIAYVVLILAVILGTAANGFAKGANGITLFIPSIIPKIRNIYPEKLVIDLICFT